MKNHQLKTGYRHSTDFLVVNNFLLAEKDRGANNRNSVHLIRRENRGEKQPKSSFPARQWVNRGENDGLDFFL